MFTLPQNVKCFDGDYYIPLADYEKAMLFPKTVEDSFSFLNREYGEFKPGDCIQNKHGEWYKVVEYLESTLHCTIADADRELREGNVSKILFIDYMVEVHP